MTPATAAALATARANLEKAKAADLAAFDAFTSARLRLAETSAAVDAARDALCQASAQAFNESRDTATA